MQEQLFYGIHVIQTLLDRNPERVLEIYIVESRSEPKIAQIRKLAQQHGVSVSQQQRKDLDKWLPKTNHQGVAAKVRAKDPLTESDLDDILQKKSNPLFLVLDGIQDPHNLGACLRTADAAGVDAVIVPKDRAASMSSVVYKISSGAAETVPLLTVTNLVRCLQYLQKKGVWIMGTSLHAKQTLFSTDLTGSTAIVLGAEGSGMRTLTEKHCDILMQIPMLGAIESLNVSVSAGVCLYEALRQRQVKK